jgi:hypothetical protein
MEIVQASSVVFIVIHTTNVDAFPDCRSVALSVDFQIVNPECGEILLADF